MKQGSSVSLQGPTAAENKIEDIHFNNPADSLCFRLPRREKKEGPLQPHEYEWQKYFFPPLPLTVAQPVFFLTKMIGLFPRQVTWLASGHCLTLSWSPLR